MAEASEGRKAAAKKDALDGLISDSLTANEDSEGELSLTARTSIGRIVLLANPMILRVKLSLTSRMSIGR